VQLAEAGAVLGAVGLAIDHHAAHTADPFPAVVVEGDGLLALLQQVFIDHVEHFEERHVLADVRGLELNHSALVVRVLLPPDIEGEVHYL